MEVSLKWAELKIVVVRLIFKQILDIMGINAKEAKKIPIHAFLEKQGFKPTRIRGKQVFYKSPFRDESKASFNINTDDNCWFDFGLGVGGNIIDLVMQLFRCNFTDALQHLEKYSHYNTISAFIKIEKSTLAENAIEVTKVIPLQNANLIAYMTQERKISRELCQIYLKELYYTNKGKSGYYGIGWQNNLQAWEIRSKYFKGIAGKKDLTTLKLSETAILYVFEGMIDFLSLLVLHKSKYLEGTVLILNSTALLNRAIEFTKQKEWKVIYTYLDNDESGNKATQTLQQVFSIQSQQEYYKGFKDVNEFLMNGK